MLPKNSENPSIWGPIKWSVKLFLWVALCWYILSVGSLSLTHLIYYKWSEKAFYEVGKFILHLIYQPWYLGEAYQKWLEVVQAQANETYFSFGVLLPVFPFFFAILVICGAYIRSPYSFALWYMMNHHFAKPEEIEKMGLVQGFLMVLGKIYGKYVQLGHSSAVLVWGNAGCGKTASVSIPSVLQSDRAPIIAVDASGALAKYTGGYREQLGEVYYLNWNLMDNKAQKKCWVRWNPLAEMPHEKSEKDKYLAKIAQSLLENEKNGYWKEMSSLALEGLLLFFCAKISQAEVNDYFLEKLLNKYNLSMQDKDILLSYYATMDRDKTKGIIDILQKSRIDFEDYVPVGSWGGIPSKWRGKELCLPMFADWFLSFYLKGINEGAEKWKRALKYYLQETHLFGYGKKEQKILQNLYYLTEQQLKIVFNIILSALDVFRIESIRERTSLSDFSMKQFRREQSNVKEVNSLYLTADNKTSIFMTKFFMNMFFDFELNEKNNTFKKPLMVIFDDFERFPKFEDIDELLTKLPTKMISILMLTDSLKNLHRVYGMDGVEDLVAMTPYKLMLAENNVRLAENLLKLAVYGTKSVQIPEISTGAFYKVKKGLSDSTYYYRIAQGLKKHYRSYSLKKNQQVLLVEGYYHLPVKVDAAFFLSDDEMRAKASILPSYCLDFEVYQNRTTFEVEVPQLIEVLKNEGLENASWEEIEEYLQKQKNKTDEDKKGISDKNTGLAEGWLVRSKSVALTDKEHSDVQLGNEWWLNEAPFETQDDKVKNPFNS